MSETDQNTTFDTFTQNLPSEALSKSELEDLRGLDGVRSVSVKKRDGVTDEAIGIDVVIEGDKYGFLLSFTPGVSDLFWTVEEGGL